MEQLSLTIKTMTSETLLISMSVTLLIGFLAYSLGRLEERARWQAHMKKQREKQMRRDEWL